MEEPHLQERRSEAKASSLYIQHEGLSLDLRKASGGRQNGRTENRAEAAMMENLCDLGMLFNPSALSPPL